MNNIYASMYEHIDECIAVNGCLWRSFRIPSDNILPYCKAFLELKTAHFEIADIKYDTDKNAVVANPTYSDITGYNDIITCELIGHHGKTRYVKMIFNFETHMIYQATWDTSSQDHTYDISKTDINTKDPYDMINYIRSRLSYMATGLSDSESFMGLLMSINELDMIKTELQSDTKFTIDVNRSV